MTIKSAIFNKLPLFFRAPAEMNDSPAVSPRKCLRWTRYQSSSFCFTILTNFYTFYVLFLNDQSLLSGWLFKSCGYSKSNAKVNVSELTQ